MNSKQDELIQILQGDIPVSAQPYAEIAVQLGITEAELMDYLRSAIKQGTIRRFGAVLRHQKVGYRINAMVAWNVEETDCDRVGALFSAYTEVTHCYWRETVPGWDYRLFTMVHGKNEQDLAQTIQEMSEKSGIHEYHVLESVKEYKKASVKFR